ncbi:hsp90 co-chaperone Cdc37 [Culicoides brevitarsis]|uniref:hsp90 co-chaperone Cdc37 n=1 Tax=Culicoides brevitarsis TaxID=469753 RepID=UPI00307C2F43
MVDYSKWKDIEVSDDEDDTHPNIDTPSLFRWRHESRMIRTEEMQKEKERFKSKKIEHQNKLKDIKEKVAAGTGDISALKKQLEELEKQDVILKKEEEELIKKEKKMPWNVDTISQPGFAKTIINKPKPRPKYDEMSEEEKERHLKEFILENKQLVKEFGMLRKYDDSKRFLMDHHQLVCEETANYLVIWCIELEMEEKHDLMEHVAHQTICMQYILELSRQLDVDPRSCVGSFFTKIQVCEPDYKAQFHMEIDGFKNRIRKRAQEKIAAALAEQEEEERKARIGPGGLDPVEVFETLPKELQECFESRNVQKLQDVISNMDKTEAAYHMKRCVDSGLWVADASKAASDTIENEHHDIKEEHK